MSRRAAFVPLLLPTLLLPGLLAQTAAPTPPTTAAATNAVDDAITEARLRELVTWIASDERLGRDCPSPGLEATAAWIGEHFAAAGLAPGVEGGFRHAFTLPGVHLDSKALSLVVEFGDGAAHQRIELGGDADVRLWRPAAAAEGSDAQATLVRSDDPRATNMFGLAAGRRAILLETDPEQPMWLLAAGARDLLSRQLKAAVPVVLLRKGALPAEATAELAVTWKGAGSEVVQVPLANVVGVLRGSTKPDEYVVVSAHYDHIGITAPVDGDAICNGADDDGTGTAAVVMLAEALAKGPRPARSIAFVCFCAEEKGLRGSRAFADAPPFPLTGVVADVNIEMIGRPEPGRQRAAWITGSEYSDFAAIATAAFQRAGIEVVPFDMAKQLFAQSDNLSLARKGVVAHSISAGSLHADYHRPSDEVGKLDLPHMTAIVRGLAAVVTDFAQREGRASYNEDGKRYLERLRDR